jgi:3-keto-disaccharide hydrolase
MTVAYRQTTVSTFTRLSIAALALSLFAVAAAGQTPPKAVPIFDGKTFAGWEGDRTIFRIQDDAIVGGSLQRDVARNEFLCTTNTYGDFELRLQVKLLGGDRANAGIQFRTRRIPNDHEVSGYQADMGVGWWGALYDESRRKKVLAGPDQEKMKGVIKADDWNDYVIRAEGTRIRLSVNGVQTVDYTEEDSTVDATGVICVQIHGGPPSEAWYKDLSLVDLTKKSLDSVVLRGTRACRADSIPAGGAEPERCQRVSRDFVGADLRQAKRLQSLGAKLRQQLA